MYLKRNGSEMAVEFEGINDTLPQQHIVEKFTSDNESVGSNKTWLYLALLFSIAAVGVSGYLLYKQSKKTDNKVGYQLY